MRQDAVSERINWLIERCEGSERALRAGSTDSRVGHAIEARRTQIEELTGMLEQRGYSLAAERRWSWRRAGHSLLSLIRVRGGGEDALDENDRALLRDYERACESPLPITVSDVLLRHYRTIKRSYHQHHVAPVSERA